MRVIAINDGRTEIFDDVPTLEESEPNWFEVGVADGISVDFFIVFPDN